MPSEPRTLPTDFLTAHLPISGGAVRRLGVGTWQIGGVTTWGGRPTGWGPTDPDEALQALRYALERGFNFFDTADAYGRGRSEELLGRAIRESGVEQVVVCTKFGSREDDRGRFFLDFSPAWLQSAVESSLRRLGRERLDILLLHSPPDDFDWENYDPTPF
ncbi:MAG: aldo/keto reductase, partial [Bacteroidetes bacterium]